MHRVIALFAVVASIVAEDVKQCMCSEFEPCEQKYENALRPCIEQCAGSLHVSDQGINVAGVKKCMNDDEPMIAAAFGCFRHDHMKACAQSSPKMVAKRYPETLKMAAMSELYKMVDAGSLNKVGPLITMAKKMSVCVEKCMDKSADGCYKKMNCGLDLPSDTQLVQEAKTCALQGGLNTGALQSLCQCISATGITSLVGVCSKIHL